MYIFILCKARINELVSVEAERFKKFIVLTGQRCRIILSLQVPEVVNKHKIVTFEGGILPSVGIGGTRAYGCSRSDMGFTYPLRCFVSLYRQTQRRAAMITSLTFSG